MKHIPYKCIPCGRETTKARPIPVQNLNGLAICNECNLKLIKEGWLRLDESVILKMTGKRGDFYTFKAVVRKTEAQREKERVEYWENRKRIDEQNQMNGFDAIIGNPSY